MSSPTPPPPAEMQKLLEEMSAQVENRIPFPLTYTEERAIIGYIRSLESKLTAPRKCLHCARDLPILSLSRS